MYIVWTKSFLVFIFSVETTLQYNRGYKQQHPNTGGNYNRGIPITQKPRVPESCVRQQVPDSPLIQF